MIELAGKHPPIDVKSASDSTLQIDFDEVSVNDEGDAKEAAARMQVICQFARESLLSYVKKDVNLTVYPGSIALPAGLFAPRLKTSQSPINDDASEDESVEPPKKRKSTPKSSSKKTTPASKPKASSKPAPAQDDDSIFGDEELLSPKKSPITTDDDPSVFGDDSPTFSPPASPLPSDTQDFDKGLDVSPISQAESPAKPPAKSVEIEKRSPAASQKASKKRKSIEIKPFDEFPSPLSNEGPSFLSSHGSSKKAARRRSKKSKSPTAAAASSEGKGKKSSSSKKFKPTPVSIESKAMINITNKSESSKKSNTTKNKRTAKTAASQSTDDEFDFPQSPPKVTGRARKSPSLLSDKASPVRKSRASAKAKVGKGKKAAESSPSTTSPTESSPASARRGNRRSARTRA
jgi:hypothetical protein